MKRFAGLKIGTGENEKVLIDEFGTPTKEGLLAAVLGAFSLLGALVVLKDMLLFQFSRMFRKKKKKLRRAKTAKVQLKNQALKQQVKASAAELKEQKKVNSDLVKEQKRLAEELSQRPAADPKSWQWKLLKKIFLKREGA